MDQSVFSSQDIWNPNSMDSIIFNRFAGPSALITYQDGILRFVKVNEQYLEELGRAGLTLQKLLDDDPWPHFSKADREKYINAMEKAAETNEAVTVETGRIGFSPLCGEETIYVRSTLRFLAEEDGKLLLHSTIRNITAETNVAQSEERFRYASEQINEYAWVYDIDSKEMRPCYRCMRDLGLPPLLENYPEPAIDMGIFPQDYADMYRDWHRQLGEGVDHLEAVIPLTPDRVPFHVRYTTTYGKDGKPAKAYGSAALVVDNSDDLKAALEDARRANASKTAFLAHMSHDIRTPLNGIIGLMEIDSRNEDNVELLKENRAKAKVAANHLLALINDVLELSKIDSKNVLLAKEPFDLNDLISDVMTISEMRAADSEISISYESSQKQLVNKYVMGSPLHVRQILLNLTGNAIKYNKPDGSVRCRARVDQTGIETALFHFIVSDTGIGMSQEFIEHIFEPFAQESYDEKSITTGTGLGMSIVKSLIDKMGGEIRINSEPNVGSTISVKIPFGLGEELPQQSPEEKAAAKAGGRSNADAGNSPDISGTRILVVEDNDLNLEIVRRLLEDSGCVITPAHNGLQAVQIFKESPENSFDVILMDVMMPVMNGLQATKEIRDLGHSDSATIPIIAMTGNAFEEDIREALSAGMNAHLAKPLDIRKVITTIADFTK